MSSVGFTRLSRSSSGLLGDDSWSECGAIVETAGQTPGRGSLTRLQLAAATRSLPVDVTSPSVGTTRSSTASMTRSTDDACRAHEPRLRAPLLAVKQLGGIRESVHRDVGALIRWAEPRAGMTFEFAVGSH